MKILIINPGSTSTKIALYEDIKELWEYNFKHSTEELHPFKTIPSQLNFRKNMVLDYFKKQKVSLQDVEVIMARGGLLKPIESGIYLINSQMISDLKNAVLQHASNLAAMIAFELKNENPNLKTYIADPVVVDELDELARYSGHPLFPRKSIFHALNHKAVARNYAEKIGKKYEDLNLLVAHLGGGITVGTHKKGKVIDVNQGLDGEGCFSPERSGTLPVGDIIRASFSGNYTEKELLKMVVGEGGMTAYMNTNNALEIEKRALAGNKKAQKVYQALAWQLGKEIGSYATVLEGKVDAIILTGGLAYSQYFIDFLKPKITFIAPIEIYAGENEMEALAQNAVWLKQGKIKLKEYK
ncbi:MAG: butyrate kinase [Flavobacteriales bacterium]